MATFPLFCARGKAPNVAQTTIDLGASLTEMFLECRTLCLQRFHFDALQGNVSVHHVSLLTLPRPGYGWRIDLLN